MPPALESAPSPSLSNAIRSPTSNVPSLKLSTNGLDLSFAEKINYNLSQLSLPNDANFLNIK